MGQKLNEQKSSAAKMCLTTTEKSLLQSSSRYMVLDWFINFVPGKGAVAGASKIFIVYQNLQRLAETSRLMLRKL